MSATIRWAGVSKDNHKRIWGYLVEPDSENWKNCTTFWGSENGKIYFQTRRMDKVFHANLKRKLRQYVPKDSLRARVIDEFEQLQVIKKLKGVSSWISTA